MNSKEVVIDTNFFMVPFQFNVDIITELEKLLPSYKLTTPSFVINELKGLKRNKNTKIRLNANLALKLANSSKVEVEYRLSSKKIRRFILREARYCLRGFNFNRTFIPSISATVSQSPFPLSITY